MLTELWLTLINHPILPTVFTLAFVVNLWLYVVTRDISNLFSMLQTGFALEVWVNRAAILNNLEPGLGDTQASQPFGQTALAIGVALTIILGAAAFLARRGASLVPVVAQTTPSVLDWLRASEHLIPIHARATFIRIRDHVTELCKLGEQLPAGQLSFMTVSTVISVDLRDLVVRYKQVEMARKMLPGMSSLGDSQLSAGLANIEATLIETRKVAAKAVLKELDVQERYIEMKHGNNDDVDDTLKRNWFDA